MVLASGYLRLVGWTSRIIVVNKSEREALESTGQGFIYAFWHGRQVLLPYLHQHDQVQPLISKSRDGQLIARVCRMFGLETIRGSSSNGGSVALLRMWDVLKSSGRIAITPDGPRGPVREVGGAIVELARRTGRPVLPLAVGAKRNWIFRSWDEYFVPKPFNRVVLVYGKPLLFTEDSDRMECAQKLKKELDEVSAEADRIAINS